MHPWQCGIEDLPNYRYAPHWYRQTLEPQALHPATLPSPHTDTLSSRLIHPSHKHSSTLSTSYLPIPPPTSSSVYPPQAPSTHLNEPCSCPYHTAQAHRLPNRRGGSIGRALPLSTAPLITFQANLSVCTSNYWLSLETGKGSWFKSRFLHFLFSFHCDGGTRVCRVCFLDYLSRAVQAGS